MSLLLLLFKHFYFNILYNAYTFVYETGKSITMKFLS